ncbi:hypothetical protein Tco_1270976, partial [Tanacetum coccineum]
CLSSASTLFVSSWRDDLCNNNTKLRKGTNWTYIMKLMIHHQHESSVDRIPPLDFLQKLCGGFNSVLGKISQNVVYKDDIRLMTRTESWIPDDMEYGWTDHDGINRVFCVILKTPT